MIPEPGITCGLNFSWFSLLGEFLPSFLSAKAKNSNSCATPGTKGQGTTLPIHVSLLNCYSNYFTISCLSFSSSPLYNTMFAPCSAVSCSVLSLISPRKSRVNLSPSHGLFPFLSYSFISPVCYPFESMPLISFLIFLPFCPFLPLFSNIFNLFHFYVFS